MISPSAVILGVKGQVLLTEECDLLAEYQPLGVILFARNIASPDQVRDLVTSIKSLLKHPYPLILIDQEGGRVARLKPPHWPIFPAAGKFLELLAKDRSKALEATYIDHRLIAHYLHDLGINVDCSPVLDLLLPDMHQIVGDRAFGRTPDEVVTLAMEACKGLMDGGVFPVIKHMPGHGRAKVDSHESLPVVEDALEVLEATDFVPFARMTDQPFAMTAHITYTALDKDRCATESPVVIDYIRHKIGFDGLLMTDDLSMKALKGSFADRARNSLSAGCDIVLHCNGDMVEMEQFLPLIPKMKGEAARRLKKLEAEFKAKVTPLASLEQSHKRLDSLVS